MDQCGENKDAVNQISALVNNFTVIVVKRYKNSRCTWQITAPAGNIVEVYIHRISFTDDKCENEYLRIYDGASSSDKLVVEYCKTKRKPMNDRVAASGFLFSGENAMLEFKQGTSAGIEMHFYTAALVKPKGSICLLI